MNRLNLHLARTPLLAETALCIAVGLALGILCAANLAYAAVASLLLAGFAALAFRQQAVALALLIATAPLVGRITIVAVPAFPDVTALRALIVICGLGLLWRSTTHQPRFPRMIPASPDERSLGRIHGLHAVVWAFLALMALAALRAVSITHGGEILADQYALPLIMLLLVVSSQWTNRECMTVYEGALLGGALWSALALVEFSIRRSFFTDDAQLWWASPATPFARTGGPFVNPAFLGTALGVVIVVCSVLLLRKHVWWPPLIALLVLYVFGLVATLTRGSWLGAIAGLLAAVAIRKSRGWRLAVLVGCVVVAALFFGSTYVGDDYVLRRVQNPGNMYNRIIAQAAAVRIIESHPLLGIGIGWFGEVSQSDLRSVGTISSAYGRGVQVPHNSILDVAVAAGMAAVAAYVAVGVLLAMRAWKLRLHWPSRSAVALGSLAVYVANAMTVDIAYAPTVSLLCVVLCGVSLRVKPGIDSQMEG